MNRNDQQSTNPPSSNIFNENYNSATQSTASRSQVGEDSRSEYAQQIEGLSYSEDAYNYNRSSQQQNGIISENAANNPSCQWNYFANNFWEIVGMLNVNKANAMGKVQQILRSTLPAEVPDEKIEICYVKESQARDSGVNSIICVRLSNFSTIQRIISERVNNAQSFSFVFGANESSYGSDDGSMGTTVTVRRVHSDCITHFMKAEAAKENRDVDHSYSTEPHSSVRSEFEAKITLRPAKDSKLLILRNGYIQRQLKFNGVYYLASNTCAFDSIAQILMTRGNDDPSYCNFIKHGPKNATMDFIQCFMNEGATDDVYRHRMALFLSLFGYKVERKTSNGSIFHPHRIDMWSTIGEVWVKCFQSRPSVMSHCWCQNCGPFTSWQSIFLVTLSKKIEFGSCLLEQTMKLNDLDSKCLSCGTKGTTILATYNDHICFEFCILLKAGVEGLRCKLEEIPTTLDLEYEYRLCGVISTRAGHFTAYCRKANNCWEEHNDSAWFIRPADPAKRIMIVCAIFTKTGWNCCKLEKDRLQKLFTDQAKLDVIYHTRNTQPQNFHHTTFSG